MQTELICVRPAMITGHARSSKKNFGVSAASDHIAKTWPSKLRESSSALASGLRRPTMHAHSTAGDRNAGFDLSVITSGKTDELRLAFIQTYQRMTEAMHELSEARQKLSNTTEQLSKEKIENMKNMQRIKVQSFEILATAGAAYARGVMETLEHRARCSNPELREERNRQAIWNTILARDEYETLSDCLWLRCKWTSRKKKRGVGEDAGKRMDALYAYLCSNIHFASIAQVPTGAETGILLPKSVGAVESTYSKALICMLDALPVNWTVIDSD